MHDCRPRVFVGRDPAPGAEVVFDGFSPGRWLVLAARWSLATDATAATRLPHLQVVHEGVVVYEVTPDAGQGASITRVYSAAATPLRAVDTTGQVAHLPLPAGLVATDKTVIRTVTGNLQAGDNYSAMAVLVVPVEGV